MPGSYRLTWAPKKSKFQPRCSLLTDRLFVWNRLPYKQPPDQPTHSVTLFPEIRTNADLCGWASSNPIEDLIPIALQCQAKIVIGLQPKPGFG